MIEGFKKSTHSHTTQINNKRVILDTRSGKYFLLNKVASKVWDLIQSDQNNTIEEAVTYLADIYDETEVVINKEMKLFIKSVFESGLISK